MASTIKGLTLAEKRLRRKLHQFRAETCAFRTYVPFDLDLPAAASVYTPRNVSLPQSVALALGQKERTNRGRSSGGAALDSARGRTAVLQPAGVRSNLGT